MNPVLRAFVVTVSPADVEIAGDRLWGLGVRAIEERTGSGGAVELWTSVGQEDDAIAAAAATLEPGWTWRVVEVSTAPADTWREHAQPNWLSDDLVITPAWIPLDVDARVTRVVIEPAGAFGLGDHPTSQLTARALRDELDRRTGPGGRGVSVLDVGCGTGVLAIVAARSGAAQVRAIDIAAEAVEATRLNADRNGVLAMIDVDDAPIEAVEGSYDVVVANILAPVLVASAADLARLTAPDGRLIISGILAESHAHVLDALAPLEVTTTSTQDGWAAVTLRHPLPGRSVTAR